MKAESFAPIGTRSLCGIHPGSQSAHGPGRSLTAQRVNHRGQYFLICFKKVMFHRVELFAIRRVCRALVGRALYAKQMGMVVRLMSHSKVHLSGHTLRMHVSMASRVGKDASPNAFTCAASTAAPALCPAPSARQNRLNP